MKGLRPFFYFVNFVLYLICVGLWIILPSSVELNLTLTLSTFFLTGVLLVLDRKTFNKYYRGHFFYELGNTLLRGFFLLATLALWNYLAFKHPYFWDLTKNQINSLTAQTQKVLKAIPDPVKVTLFSRASDFPKQVALLELYRLEKKNLVIKLIDLDLRPDLARAHEITQAGTVLLERGEKKKYIVVKDELSLTNGFIQIVREKNPVIGFFTNHGELDLENEGIEGASHLKSLISAAGYDIQAINLMENKQLPSGVETLVILGPAQSLFPEEVDLIKKFLDEEHGQLLVALDPKMGKDPFENLKKVLNEKGILLHNDLVVDQVSFLKGSQGAIPLVKEFSQKSSITKELKEAVYFPAVSSVAAASEDASIEFLAQTSPFPGSWADKDPKEMLKGTITFSEKKDTKGPVAVMASWEEESSEKKRARIVVVGNSTFVQNHNKTYRPNFTLFLNALSWMNQDDLLMSFNDIHVENKPLLLTSAHQNVIFFFSVIFIPLALIFFAGWNFFRRGQK